MLQLDLWGLFREYRHCPRCKESFPAASFEKRHGGFHRYCSDCREYFRDFQRERREKKRLFGQPLYYDLHKEKQKAYSRRYYQTIIKTNPYRYKNYLDIHKAYESRPEIKQKNRIYNWAKYRGFSIAYCPVCGQYKPATPEYFLERRGSDIGIFPFCLECSKSKYNQDAFWGEVNFNNQYRRVLV